MEAFLTSTLIVALAEIGDKTQLLSLVLAARYKKPLPIIAGILIATLANHFIAGALGAWISSLFSPQVMRWIVGGSLLAIAAWTLKPDKLDGEVRESTHYGAFALTCAVFFVAVKWQGIPLLVARHPFVRFLASVHEGIQEEK